MKAGTKFSFEHRIFPSKNARNSLQLPCRYKSEDWNGFSDSVLGGGSFGSGLVQVPVAAAQTQPPKQLDKYVVSSPWQVHRAVCVQKVVSGLHPHLTLQHL